MARIVTAAGVSERRSAIGGVVFGGTAAGYSVRRNGYPAAPVKGAGHVSPGSIARFSHVWHSELSPAEKAAWNSLGSGRVSGLQVGQRWRSQQDN